MNRENFYNLGSSSIVALHTNECKSYFDVYESVNRWHQSHQANTISKEDAEEQLREMKNNYDKLKLQCSIWELSTLLYVDIIYNCVETI